MRTPKRKGKRHGEAPEKPREKKEIRVMEDGGSRREDEKNESMRPPRSVY